MTRFSRLFLTIAAAFAAGNLHAQTPAESISPSALTSLSPGDQIRVYVWRDEKKEFSGDYTIAPNGTIIHPLYRDIQVTGVPLSTVEDRIRVFLTRYFATPQFVIQPLVKIIVGGEVRTPNVFSVPPETTIAQAVALAGGPTDRAEPRKLKIIRDGQEISVDITKADSDVARLQIRSGDQILMPRRARGAGDYVAPVLSAVAASAAILNIFLR